jgi:Arm DNA-binding domain
MEKKTKKYSVRLREKALSSGNKSLYLDIWFDGKRKYEFLKLYIVKSKKPGDKELNKKTKNNKSTTGV